MYAIRSYYVVCEAERIMKERGMDSDCRVEIHVPDETFKRHGQAIVARNNFV